MARGMATKRKQIFVPRITSWRLISTLLSNRGGLMFNLMIRSDFFLRDEDDKLCAVFISLGSSLESMNIPFSTSHSSLEPIVLTISTNSQNVNTQQPPFLFKTKNLAVLWLCHSGHYELLAWCFVCQPQMSRKNCRFLEFSSSRNLLRSFIIT